MTTSKKGTVIPLFPTEDRRGALERKLKREFETPSALFRDSFREDVYNVLLLTAWSDEVALRLIQMPDLLRTVMLALRDDEVFDTFYERRIKQLTLDLVAKQ